jgi:hypothetical protein
MAPARNSHLLMTTASSLWKQAAPRASSPSPRRKGNPYTTRGAPFFSPHNAASNPQGHHHPRSQCLPRGDYPSHGNHLLLPLPRGDQPSQEILPCPYQEFLHSLGRTILGERAFSLPKSSLSSLGETLPTQMPKSSLGEIQCIPGLVDPSRWEACASAPQDLLRLLGVLVLPKIDPGRLIHLDLQFLGNEVNISICGRNKKTTI